MNAFVLSVIASIIASVLFSIGIYYYKLLPQATKDIRDSIISEYFPTGTVLMRRQGHRCPPYFDHTVTTAVWVFADGIDQEARDAFGERPQEYDRDYKDTYVHPQWEILTASFCIKS